MARKKKTAAPVVPAAPPETFAQKLDRLYAEKKAKLKAQAAEFGPPKAPPFDAKTITSDTVLSGKTVAEWSAEIAIRDENTARGALVDYSDLPPFVTWAVAKWHGNGCPTPSTKVLDQITKLRQDAEDAVKFSNLDREKAAKEGNPKKAKKLLEAAQKKSDKAATLFAEADRLAVEHKEGTCQG